MISAFDFVISLAREVLLGLWNRFSIPPGHFTGLGP